MGEYISCGTIMRNRGSSLQAEQPVKRRGVGKSGSNSRLSSQTDLERQVLNNEYLKILKDPKFSDLNVNFLEF